MKPYLGPGQHTYGRITYGWRWNKARWRRAHRRRVSARWPRVFLWRDAGGGLEPYPWPPADTFVILYPRWRRRREGARRMIEAEPGTARHALLWQRGVPPDRFGRWVRLGRTSDNLATLS